MTTPTAKKTAKPKKATGKPAARKSAAKAQATTGAAEDDAVDAQEAAPAKAKAKPRAKKAAAAPAAPAAKPRITTVRGTTTIHHGDAADLAIVEGILPTIDAIQAEGAVVPYLLACSEGAMHLSIALPGQNLPYSQLPGLTLTIDPYTLETSLDRTPIGVLDARLVSEGGLAMLESLRPDDGDAVTPLGWRQDWQPQIEAAAAAYAATRAAA